MFGLLSFGLSLFGVGQQMAAGGKAVEAGRIAAGRIEGEGKEEVRRKTNEMMNTLGLTSAAVGASGIKLTGSAAKYVDTLRSEFESDIEWIKESTKSRVAEARAGGAAAQAGAMAGATSTLAGGIGSFNSYGSDAGWW